MPPKKKKSCGVPFVKGDPRCNRGGATSDGSPGLRRRESKSVYDAVATQMGTVPPGATLRPFVPVAEVNEFATTSQSCWNTSFQQAEIHYCCTFDRAGLTLKLFRFG